MTFRLLAGGLAGLMCGAAQAQPLALPTPASYVQPPEPAAGREWTAEVTPGTSKSANAASAWTKAMADARQALAATYDYTATMVRQERVHGMLQPEQACGLIARTKPAAVAVTVLAPKPYAGQWTSFAAARSSSLVRYKPDAAKPTKTVPADDPSAMAGAKYPVTGYGLAAVLDRVETVVRTQQVQHRPTQVLAADYLFAGQPVTRFEVFADHPSADSPRRLVLCLDAATKLPVRYEAYGAATPANPGGEVLEVVSFLGTRRNVGLGDAAFER